jgi:hypothetical protein
MPGPLKNHANVAQISNLLYRGLPAGKPVGRAAAPPGAALDMEWSEFRGRSLGSVASRRRAPGSLSSCFFYESLSKIVKIGVLADFQPIRPRCTRHLRKPKSAHTDFRGSADWRHGSLLYRRMASGIPSHAIESFNPNLIGAFLWVGSGQGAKPRLRHFAFLAAIPFGLAFSSFLRHSTFGNSSLAWPLELLWNLELGIWSLLLLDAPHSPFTLLLCRWSD